MWGWGGEVTGEGGARESAGKGNNDGVRVGRVDKELVSISARVIEGRTGHGGKLRWQ